MASAGLPKWLTQTTWPEPKVPKAPNAAQAAQNIWGNIYQNAGNVAAQEQRLQNQLALQQQKVAGAAALQPNEKVNLYNAVSAAIAASQKQADAMRAMTQAATQANQTTQPATTQTAANFNAGTAVTNAVNAANAARAEQAAGATVNDAPPTNKQGWEAWWQAVRDAIMVAKQRFPELTQYLSDALPDLGATWNPVAGIAPYWFHTQELIDAATVGDVDRVRDFARRLQRIYTAGQGEKITPPVTGAPQTAKYTDAASLRSWWNTMRQVVRDNGGPDIGEAQSWWGYKPDLQNYYFDAAEYAAASPQQRQVYLEKLANLQQDIERIGQFTGWTPPPASSYSGGAGGAWADWASFLNWWNQSIGNTVDLNLSPDEQERMLSYIKGKYPNATVSSFFRGLYTDYNVQRYKDWRDQMYEYQNGFTSEPPAKPGDADYPAIAEFMDFLGDAYNYAIGLGAWPYAPQHGGGGGASDAARKLEQQLNALLQKWGNTVVSGAIRSGAHPTSYYY